jgi:hypothetical protein
MTEISVVEISVAKVFVKKISVKVGIASTVIASHSNHSFLYNKICGNRNLVNYKEETGNRRILIA